jgi:hypothetical protein
MTIPVFSLYNPYSTVFTITQTTGGSAIIKWTSVGTAKSYSYLQTVANTMVATDSLGNLYCAGTYNSGTAVPIYNFLTTQTASALSLPATNPSTQSTTCIIKWSSTGQSVAWTAFGPTDGSVIGPVTGMTTDNNNNLYLNVPYSSSSPVQLLDFTTTSTTTSSLSLTLPNTSNISGVPQGNWVTTGSMTNPRALFDMCKLASGSVLVAGGFTSGTTTPTPTCEVYTPATGQWTVTGSLNTARSYAQCNLLPNGQVLATGGYNGTSSLSSCELYNPNTGTWTTTGSLITARYRYQTALLDNGTVIAVGGDNSGTVLGSCEVYNPGYGTWTTTGSLVIARRNFSMRKLANGSLLVCNGDNNTSTGVLASEIYYPTAGTWAISGIGQGTTGIWYASSASLLNSQVLLMGGTNSSLIAGTSQIYNPVNNYWNSSYFNPTTTGTFIYGSMVQVPSGDIVYAGNSDTNCYVFTQNAVNNSGLNTWSTTGSLVLAHQNTNSDLCRNLALLNNGTCLIVGGNTAGTTGTIYTASCELYNPVAYSNAIIKYNASGSVESYQVIPNAFKYTTTPIDNSLVVDDFASLSSVNSIGANSTIYDMNFTTTANTLSRATLAAVNNVFSTIPESTNWTKWSLSDGTANLDPYSQNFLVNLPVPTSSGGSTSGSFTKTVIPVTKNYTYKLNTSGTAFTLKGNQVLYDGSSWYNY